MRCYVNKKRYIVGLRAADKSAVRVVSKYVWISWMRGLVEVVDNGPDGVLLLARTSRGVKREIKDVLKREGLDVPVRVQYV